MSQREFMAFGQPDVEVAACLAAPFGWSVRPVPHDELTSLGIEGRAVELGHPRAPISVVLVEAPARRGSASSGAFVYLSAGVKDSFRLSALLRNPAICELVSALGDFAKRSRCQSALGA